MHIDVGPWQVRSYREDDAETLARYANNRRVWRNLNDFFPHPYTVNDAKQWIALTQREQPERNFAIASQTEPIGAIGLKLRDNVSRHTAEIGYWLGEPFWGQGIATAALRATTNFAFAHFDLARLEAYVYEWNPASCRVLEKAGYTQEARLRKAVYKDGQLIDQFLYAKIRGGD